MKNKKILIWGLIGIGILVLLLLGYLSLTADTVEKKIVWNYYPDYGSSDVEVLRISWYKYSNDTTIVDSKDIDVSVLDSFKITTFETDYIYKICMYAIDTTGLMSISSNVVILDLLKPISVKGLKIE